MCSNEKFRKDDGSGDTEGERYRSLVGKLIYLTHTRPDTTYSVDVLSRFMNKTYSINVGAGKQVLRYLVGTIDFKVHYTRAAEFKLEGFCDIDWGGNVDD